jgi:hypothetical protein
MAVHNASFYRKLTSNEENNVGKSSIFLSGFGLLVSSHVIAQPTPGAEALSLITKTAGEICLAVDQKGSKTSAQLNSEVDAKLNGVWAKFADLGIKLGASYDNKSYVGLPQEAVATAIKNHDECSLKVLYFLGDKMGLGTVPATGTTSAPRWADIGVIGDWGSRDYAHTTTATPKYSIGSTALCDEKQVGHVAVCWEGRSTGYPAGDLTDVPAGQRPTEWCAYKNNLVTLSTARDGATPGRLYVCARSVP